MVGKPPGAWFITAVAAFCFCMLAVDWIGSSAVHEEIRLIVMLAGLLTVIVVIGRTVLTFRSPRREAKAFMARACAAPVLLVVSLFALSVFPPSEVRLKLSEDSLNEFARTVTSTDMCSEGFRPRRVGLYKVTCADREGDKVSLQVDVPWIKTRGTLWLTGPGDWDTWLQD